MKRLLIALALAVVGVTLWWALKAPRSAPTAIADDRRVGSVGADAAVATPVHVPDAGLELEPLPALRGEVRDETGGVPQAALEARLRGKPDDASCAAHAKTTSVSGGAFDFGTLCPGQYDVRATRGALVATAVARLARGTEHEPLFLLLREGTRLTVRVRDGDKAPLGAVAVSVQDSQTGYLVEGLTADTGAATLDGLTPRIHSVWGRKPGYLDASLFDRTLAAGEDQVDLTLLAGVTQEGKVVSPDGEGLDGVWVRLAVRRKQLGSTYDSVEGSTSRDGGEFVIGPVRPGAYTLVASHDRYTAAELPVRVPGPRALVKLGRGATVEGVFLDADGAPVTEGNVNGAKESDNDRQTEPDEWGRFKLEGLGPGRWAILGLSRPADGGREGIAIRQVTVKQETKLQVTLQLERGERIEGRCVGSDGSKADTHVAAVEQALYQKLRMTGFDATKVPPGSIALSSCSDRFLLEGLKPGRYALLACGNDEDPTLASTGARDVTVTCREGRLRFRVVDPAGRPVEAFALGTGDTRPESHPGGRYEGPLMGEVDQVLTVRAPGFAPLQRWLQGKRGTSLDLGDLQLAPARKLRGRVEDARDSTPVSAAEVYFGVAHEDALGRARTRGDGTFELADVPREPGRLWVRHPRYVERVLEVTSAADTLTVTLTAGLELSGAVITRDGREVSGFTVEARGADGSTRTSSVTDGRYTLGSFEPGDWKLRLAGPDVSAFDPKTVTLIGSGSITADFVERQGGVTVTVLPLDDEQNPIVALAWLLPGRRARPAADAEAWSLATSLGLGSEGDPSGTHTFSSVPPGPYTVMVRVRDVPGMFWVEAIEVSSGMPAPLRLSMPRGLEPR